jgi:hypothetical protein
MPNYRSPDFFAKRDTESQLGYEMRVRPYLAHRADAPADPEEAQAWAAHRAQVDNRVGTGSGLYGHATPQERATAAGTRGFGGDQRPIMTGGTATTSVPGSPPSPACTSATWARASPASAL